MNKYFILFISLFTLTFCSSEKSGDTGVVMRLPGDPPTLDWNLATDNVSREVIMPLQEGLTDQSPDSEVTPSLAESWEISDDGTVYTFKLRKGVKWSDGVEFTAQHVADSWERLITPSVASEYAYFIFDILNAEEFNTGKINDFSQVGVKVLDPHTLQVKLKHAAAYWINIPSFWVTFPIRKDLIEKHGDKWTQAGNLVSLGPYTLKSYKRESKLELEPNPHYWDNGSNPKAPKKVVFRIVKENSVSVSLFDSKSIDIVRDLPPIQIPTLSKRPEFVLSNQFRGYYVAFNVKGEKTSNAKLRKALALAINRKELKSFLHVMIEPTSSWIPKGMFAYNGERGIKYDPKAAKELWDSIPNKPEVIDLWFNTGDKEKLVGENLQSQWKRNLGANVRLTFQDWKVYLKTLKTNTPDSFRLGWGADYPDPDNFMNLFTCNSGNNNTHFCSKRFDELIQAAAGESDPEKRLAQYDEAQKILLEQEVAIVPLFGETAQHLVSPRIEGFKINPMGDFAFKNLKVNK